MLASRVASFRATIAANRHSSRYFRGSVLRPALPARPRVARAWEPCRQLGSLSRLPPPSQLSYTAYCLNSRTIVQSAFHGNLLRPVCSAARNMATAAGKKLEFELIDVHNPKEYNFILGHAHFIKTVEDLYEALVQSSTALKFGIAFNEASPGYEAMPGRKVRFDGNSRELIELAKMNAIAIGAGHTFIVFLDGGFPVNCLNAVKGVPEVCRIHCATSNPTSVVIAKTSDDEKGIMGVIDGVCPTDFETEDDKIKRHDFLRVIGYKR